MADPTVLYYHKVESIVLNKMIKDMAIAAQIGLFYAPAWCRFGRVEDSLVMDHKGQAMDISQVYEARVFCQDMELRWRRDPQGAGEGCAVCLSEQRQEGQQWLPLEAMKTMERHYLLWGQARPDSGLASGWSRLLTARIGSLPVPVANLKDRQRVRLISREYLGCSPGKARDHGNMAVVEERLLRLEPYSVQGD